MPPAKTLVFIFQSQALLHAFPANFDLPSPLWAADWRPYLEPFMMITEGYGRDLADPGPSIPPSHGRRLGRVTAPRDEAPGTLSK